jgi:hypothetical protein
VRKEKVDNDEVTLKPVGTYPPVGISKDMLYVILLSCGSRRMDSGVLDLDLGYKHLSYTNQSTFALA